MLNLIFKSLFTLALTPVLTFSAEVVIIGDSLSVGSSWDDIRKTRSGLGRELGKLLEKEGHLNKVVPKIEDRPILEPTIGTEFEVVRF